ncbi:MAG TPA: chromate transporter, partial [Cyclobacteriaceae bacterium]|nr:chromate transporter [Cyclobacteriaceae bacterium]
MTQRVRYYTFLRDVALLSVTTFGGPQAHIAHFDKILVKKRNYLSEADLTELNSLCQILPGPSSTQTLVAVGFKIGGPNLAYLTLLLWTLPSVIFMTIMAISLFDIEQKNWSLEFTRFIQPMAVGFVSYAAYSISVKTINTKTGISLMVIAAVTSYFIQTPFVFPVILFGAGLISALKYRAQPKEDKKGITIRWSNFILWLGVLV